MYSNKENVNILTALLVACGIEDAVVCPGSRNAPIVHNLNECPSIRCYPVTDERSAGFYALGLAQATAKPVAVCVTSGTALLNLAPAVAEAFYQHLPLVVISADRPAAWIDQLDGQTLPQPDALGRFVDKAVTLPEPKDDTERWYCNRLVNEALYAVGGCHPQPVHINVPISEPLFDFTVSSLPEERVVKRLAAEPREEAGYGRPMPPEHGAGTEGHTDASHPGLPSRGPLVVVGQNAHPRLFDELVRTYARQVVILHEPLGASGTVAFDEVLYSLADDGAFRPDRVVYVGDTIVSKRLRQFLRRSKARTLLLTVDDRSWADPTMSLDSVVKCPHWKALQQVLNHLLLSERFGDAGCGEACRHSFCERWYQALQTADTVRDAYEPKYSQMAVVKYFEEQLEDFEGDFEVHYANSSAIRLANVYASHHVWCNRGVNGIEGSLSTAAGYSLSKDDDSRVFCLIGDLSFFYDQNALWNQNLKGNLRIILLNNHGGGIFRQLRGLDGSLAALPLVGAAHATEAQGICTQNDIGYLKATNMEEMQIGVVNLMTREARRPMLLEVVTDAEEDAAAVKTYYRKVKKAVEALLRKQGPAGETRQ